MRKALKITAAIVLTIVIFFGLFLAIQTLTEYRPLPEQLFAEQPGVPVVNDTLTVISWNVGYFGLGADMDFFYEGGTMVRPTNEQYQRYRQMALQRIASFDTAAFIFLQEIDTFSRRSYYDNQLQAIQKELPEYKSYFATNYHTWVPIPLNEPMGKVRAGQVTLSEYSPVSAKRVSFESSYEWPMRLFMLKRCYLELRFNTNDGKELVLINTHNSAYSDADALREKELAQLKQCMINEYSKGNYVVIGGDWNQNPPAFDTATLLPAYKAAYIQPGIPNSFLPEGWTCAFDPLHTTNRFVNIPYQEGKTTSTLIDFFVLSPNIRLQSIKTIPTEYREADHQPVVLKIVI